VADAPSREVVDKIAALGTQSGRPSAEVKIERVSVDGA
jgi:hypothetical protein